MAMNVHPREFVRDEDDLDAAWAVTLLEVFRVRAEEAKRNQRRR